EADDLPEANPPGLRDSGKPRRPEEPQGERDATEHFQQKEPAGKNRLRRENGAALVDQIEGHQRVQDRKQAGLDELAENEGGWDEQPGSDESPEQARRLGIEPEAEQQREQDRIRDGNLEEEGGAFERGIPCLAHPWATAGPKEEGEQRDEQDGMSDESAAFALCVSAERGEL